MFPSDFQNSVMYRELFDSYPPVGPCEIQKAEDELGLDFPADYRIMIQMRNGGHFTADVSLMAPDESDSLLGLATVYAIDTEWDDRSYAEDLRAVAQVHHGRIRAGALAIATDGEDLICIDCLGSGEIGLWNRDDEMSMAPEMNWRPLASSLSEFIRRTKVDFLGVTQERLPLFSAIEAGAEGVVCRLLDSGTAIEFTNDREQTPLIATAVDFRPRIMRELIRRGANLEHKDRWGHTALFWALKSMDMVRMLVEAGADVNPTNHEGRPDLSRDYLQPRVVKFLEEHGARFS